MVYMDNNASNTITIIIDAAGIIIIMKGSEAKWANPELNVGIV